MNCIDVIRKIILELHLEKARFVVFEHSVTKNWRVRYTTVSQKYKQLKKGLIQHQPHNVFELWGYEVLDGEFAQRTFTCKKRRVISISSRVLCDDGRYRHIAMMNLHPERELTIDNVVTMLKKITGNMPGYLLRSGRYYHFYGIALLEEEEWVRFLAQFLMPTIIVSPRYIGHSLHRGYTALRLSTDPEYKPLLPEVCCLITTSKRS